MSKTSKFSKGASPLWFFWANLVRKDSFGIFWIKQHAFLPDKWSCKKSKKNQNDLKRLVHGFCQKNRNFYLVCFLGKSSQKRLLSDTLERKECFFFHQKSEFFLKTPKNLKFFKGVSPWFLSKNQICLVSFFGGGGAQIKPEKVVCWYSG